MRTAPLIILLVSACGLTSANIKELDLENLPDEINLFLNTKITSPEVERAFDLLRQRKKWDYAFTRMDMKLSDGLDEQQIRMVNCDTCKMLVNTAISWADAGDTPELMAEKYTTLCAALNIASEHVCRGMGEMRSELALWIYTQKNQTDHPFTAEDYCGFNLHWECWVGGEQYEWSLDFDWLGPKPTPEDTQIPEPGSPTFKVLQLTDIHIDPNYIVGGNAACDDSNCCRWEQGIPIWPEDEAGYWGDYRKCDMPLHAFQNLLDQIATHTEVDYIIFTGDIIEHATWATTIDSNREEIIYALTQMFDKLSVKVLPLLGNHESHPTHIFTSNAVNQSLPEHLSSSWLYEVSSVLWSIWIPNAKETITKGGYYSYEVNSDLKVIGLNMNFCYNFNWYLLYDSFDVSDQLMWLAGELLAAEQANQKVHILAHIPLSSDCFPGYAIQYSRLVDRFENTIVAQFHGHTHQEHFNLYYSPDDPSRAINVGFVGGSGTAFGSVNPNYRIYTVDGNYAGSSYRVLDHETWFYNLTQANLDGEGVSPNWQILYSFKDAFGLESLLPRELDSLVRRLATDADLLDLYTRLRHTMADPKLEAGCDDSCRRSSICEILRTVQGDNSKCDELMPIN